MAGTMQYVLDKVVPSLLGTIAGAFIAFRVKRNQDANDEEKRRQSSANYALFVLTQQISILVNTERNLAEHRVEGARKYRWAEMKRLLKFDEPLPHKAEALGWMLEVKLGNLLGRYLAARNGYLTVMGLIERRNAIKTAFDDFLEEKIKEGALKPVEGKLPSNEVEAIVSFRMRTELEESCERLLSLLAEVFHEHYELAMELHRECKKIWPDSKFVYPEPMDELLNRFHLSIPNPGDEKSPEPRVHRMSAGGLEV